ncbi:MAG: protein kinase [Dokdonella sp.]|uniref:serine/threonine-protein kinase n=1 Tax=Dokdonella sp. TaxID=2291710 RepID=UPI003263788F
MTTRDVDSAALLIVRDALDLDTDAERERLVAARCTDQPELRERVRTLLARIAVEDGADATVIDPVDALIGERLGAFRVVEAIGRGGMGVVYRGERDGDDFAQVVAIKLIRRGFDFDDVHARFLRERRILARLSHPNLARFIDGGRDGDGRPWFALEFVDGAPITRWCDAHRLGVRERVRLLIEAADAVQYAHTQLVVHRDLKPGNVLVDSAGVVRLLDFGVAGLLAGDSAADSLPSTISQRHAITPEYAAPEQFGGDDVGVAADVYALGVILHELVSGSLPYALDRRDAAAAERIVRQTPPQMLSNAVRDDDAGRKQLALLGVSLQGYRSDVRGDLSRIAEKALAKEPARRYATVQAFAEDLARWLAGDPVRVSGNSVRYRLGKFVLRNRLLLAIAGVGVLAIVIGIAATVWQARKATRAAADATAQATRATAARDFLASLLGKASPEEQGSATTTVREVLDRARQRIAGELVAQPGLRVEMSTLIGRTYNDLAQYDDALPLLADAVAIADSDPTIAVLTRADAHAEYASALFLGDAAKDAEAHARIAIDLLRKQGAGQALAGPLDTLGATLYMQGRHAEGLLAQQEATHVVGEYAGADSEAYAAELVELSYPLAAAERYDEAVTAAKRALAILDQRYPDGRHPSVSRALWAIGNTLSSADRDAEAIAYLERAKNLVAAIYGKDGLKMMRAEQLLGVGELETGNLAGATAHLADAERLLAAHGPDHPLRALGLGYLGSSLLRSGDAVAAEQTLRSGLDLALAGERADLADSIRINLARSLTAQRKPAAALALLDDVEPRLRAQSSRRLPAALIARSEALRSAGNWRGCAAPLKEATAMSATSGRTVRINLAIEQARVAAAEGNVAERQRHAERALQLLAESGAQRAPEFGEAQALARN